jgi:hypothetical protein
MRFDRTLLSVAHLFFVVRIEFGGMNLSHIMKNVRKQSHLSFSRGFFENIEAK